MYLEQEVPQNIKTYMIQESTHKLYTQRKWNEHVERTFGEVEVGGLKDWCHSTYQVQEQSELNRNTKEKRDICTPIFIIALFTVTKKCNNLSVHEFMSGWRKCDTNRKGDVMQT
jgi:hypothetical protein